MSLPTSPVALVAGGSSGIGAAIAHKLGQEGHSVAVVGARSVEQGQEVASKIPDGVFIQADLEDPASVATLVDEVADRFGRLDTLVYAAGATQRIPHQDLDAVTDEVWEKILGANVLAPWRLIRAAAPALRESGAGNVVLIGALAGSTSGGSSIPYAVSKAASQHMIRLLGGALGPRIRVNAIAPGFIETRWTKEWDGLRAHIESKAPLGRTGQPEEIAELVVGLLKSTYVTGQTVIADGGFSVVP